MIVAALVVALPLLGTLGPGQEGPLPDGGARPVVVRAELAAPSAGDRLLEARLVVDAHDADGIVAYEYRWNRATLGPIRRTDARHPTVSFLGLEPATRYALEVRAVDGRGWRSPWVPAFAGETPPPPVVVVAGDSVASGYHKAAFLLPGTCRDESWSYGRALVDELAGRLGEAWRPRLRLVAWPGAGVEHLLAGGADSCGTSHPPQLDEIEDLVDPATWHVVVVTAGVNSTNWVDVVTVLTRDTALALDERADAEACRRAVAERWDLPARRDALADEVARAVAALEATGSRVVWTGYYGIDGTRLVPGWTPIGEECAALMALALDDLHRVIRRGLAGRATWVELGHVPVSTQWWAGWPHPDAEGHRRIGTEVAAAIPVAG